MTLQNLRWWAQLRLRQKELRYGICELCTDICGRDGLHISVSFGLLFPHKSTNCTLGNIPTHSRYGKSIRYPAHTLMTEHDGWRLCLNLTSTQAFPCSHFGSSTGGAEDERHGTECSCSTANQVVRACAELRCHCGVTGRISSVVAVGAIVDEYGPWRADCDSR